MSFIQKILDALKMESIMGKEQIHGSGFCHILEIFIKIRFQSAHDRIFHV